MSKHEQKLTIDKCLHCGNKTQLLICHCQVHRCGPYVMKYTSSFVDMCPLLKITDQ